MSFSHYPINAKINSATRIAPTTPQKDIPPPLFAIIIPPL